MQLWFRNLWGSLLFGCHQDRLLPANMACLCDSWCNSFSFASLNRTRSPHSHFHPHCGREGPFGMDLFTSESVFLPLLCKTSHSCVLTIVISVWLLSSILHEAPEWTWLLLATLNKYFRVSSSFARSWVCFWMLFKRRKGECRFRQLCSYQNSLLIFRE